MSSKRCSGRLDRRLPRDRAARPLPRRWINLPAAAQHRSHHHTNSADVDQVVLELLKDTVPSIARVAVPQNPDAASNRLTEPGGSLQVAAQQLGMQLVHMDVKGPEDLDTALEAGTRAGADAILWGGTQAAGDFRHPAYRSRLAALAAQYRLPTMSAFAGWAQAGILMTYGSSTAAQFRRAAAYVDKILKGVKPADLPVEQPMTFDFVINLKTAQALGLTIPHHVLLQATEVIQ
jgi:putative ABC transport system substrate-binding protein